MAASPIKELYVSPNGDRWILGENQGGELVVCHDPNKRSGGAPSEIALDVFLSHGGQGPEYQALAEALANLEVAGKKHPTIRYFRPKQSRNWITLLEKLWHGAGVA